MKIAKLLKSHGFTLMEVIVTTLIVTLLTLAITVGTQSALTTYRNSLFVSEGDMLVNNLEISLGDMLRFSTYGATDALDGKVTFSNGDYGINNGYFFIDDGVLFVHPIGSDTSAGAKRFQVVNKKAYSNVAILDFTLTYDSTTQIYDGKYKIADKMNTSLQREVTFCFRSLKIPSSTTPSPP